MYHLTLRKMAIIKLVFTRKVPTEYTPITKKYEDSIVLADNYIL